MAPSFDFEAPDFFTTGTVGVPGRRTFYLQAREAGSVVTLKLERSRYARWRNTSPSSSTISPMPGALRATCAARAGERGLGGGLAGRGLRRGRRPHPIVAEELSEEAERRDEDDDERRNSAEEFGAEEGPRAARAPADPAEMPEPAEPPDTAKARFRLTRPQAAAFVERARSLVQAGRPSCRLCGLPMDPDGHTCPGTNGHVRH